MRVVRVADRAHAEPARRRERVRQLRDRAGARRVRPGQRLRRPRSSTAVEDVGYSARLPAARARSGRARSGRGPAAPADRRERALAARAPARGDPRVPVRRTGSGSRSSSRPRSCCGRAGRSTSPPGRTCVTALATMDTLISVGTLAAWGWSVVALFLLDAGVTGLKMPFRLLPAHSSATDQIYLEVAAVVILFQLAGRYFEARAKRRAGAALRALVELGAKEAAILDDDGTERLVPIERARSRGSSSSSAPARRSPPTASSSRAARRSTSRCSRARACPSRWARAIAWRAPRSTSAAGCVVRAERVGADTALAQIARLVSAAQSGKAPVQRLADRVSAVFVPVVLVLSLATFAYWSRDRRRLDVRVLDRRRRADRRLPVRARPRDADGAARRDRPRGAARDPDQRPGDPRVDAAGRHDRPRQDRHRHRGEADAGRDRHGGRRRARPRRCGSSVRSSMRRSIRSGGRSPRAAQAVGDLPAVDSFANSRRASASQGVVDGPRGRRRASGVRRGVGARARRPARRGDRRPRRRPAGRRSSPAGTAWLARCSSSPTRSSRRRRRRCAP